MKCPKCEKEIINTDYCSNCGEKLEDLDRILVKSDKIYNFVLMISTAIMVIIGIFFYL